MTTVWVEKPRVTGGYERANLDERSGKATVADGSSYDLQQTTLYPRTDRLVPSAKAAGAGAGAQGTGRYVPSHLATPKLPGYLSATSPEPIRNSPAHQAEIDRRLHAEYAKRSAEQAASSTFENDGSWGQLEAYRNGRQSVNAALELVPQLSLQELNRALEFHPRGERPAVFRTLREARSYFMHQLEPVREALLSADSRFLYVEDKSSLPDAKSIQPGYGEPGLISLAIYARKYPKKVGGQTGWFLRRAADELVGPETPAKRNK